MNVIYRYAPGAAISVYGAATAINSYPTVGGQREAYILSQKSEGWTPVATHYDDGGFSGGSMDRPVPKALLGDIAPGRINLVVVYKVDRLLLVNETEAPIVRELFRLYIALRSVPALAEELERRGVLSKLRTSAAGNVTGGLPFSRGALFHLLRNRIYLGEIVHRGMAYPGLHAVIVDVELFEAAQVQLAANRLVRKEGVNGDRSPRCGLLFDHAGSPMSPTHSRGKSGGR